jgi:hypothetical protein
MSGISSSIARKIKTVTALLTFGTVADGEFLKRDGSTIVGAAAGGGGIGGSTGSTDNAILRANGTGGSTVQGSLPTISDAGAINVVSGAGINAPTDGYILFSIADNWGAYLTITPNVGEGVPSFKVQRDGMFLWGSGFGAPSTPDTGLARNAAGVVEVNNGVAGVPGVLLLRGQTIASLPASPVLGMRATVTDGDSGLAWGATVVNTGAGTTRYLVWYNGTNWTVVGK